MEILNPLTNPVFPGLTLILSLLLTLGLLAVWLFASFSSDKSMNGVLFKRWCSWAMIAFLSDLAICAGALCFSLLAALLSAVCVQELCNISGKANWDRALLLASAVGGPLTAFFFPQFQFAFFMLFAFVLLFAALSSADSKLDSFCLSLVFLLYVPLLSSFAVSIYCLGNWGPAALAALVVSSALANVFAFVFGKLLAGPKLAEKISPNKTWSGVFGSILGAYIGFLPVFALLASQHSFQLLLFAPPLVAFAGVLGDLFESWVKRSCKVKDAGTWLPGFGGLMDRVDGLLFVFPVLFQLFVLLAE